MYSFIDREEYQMGSLSHYINCRAIGYQDLPQFPDSPTDSSVRCVVVPEEQEKPVKQKTERTTTNKKKTFYSDSEENSENSSDESDDSDSDSTDSSSNSSYEKIEPLVNQWRELKIFFFNFNNYFEFIEKRKICEFGQF